MLNNDIRQSFPMLVNNPNLVYLDSGATSLKPQSVIDAITYFYTHTTSNVHRGDYPISVEVSNAYDTVRKKVAQFIHASSSKEIVFTSGATQGLNWIAFGYGYHHLNSGDVVLTTHLEHASNILPWFNVCKQKQATIKYIPVTNSGKVDLNAYEQLLKDNPVKFVCIGAMSNVLGCVQPIQKMSTLAHKYNALMVVDGAQSVAHITTNVTEDAIDFLAFSGHKMLAGSGIGVLYGKKALLDSMDPLLFGGGSNGRFNDQGEIILKETPEKFESGTPNIEGVLGLGAAIDYLNSIGMDFIEKHEKDLKSYAVNQLKALDHVILYNEQCEHGLISFNVKNIFAQDVAGYLAMNSIAVRSGNHCAKILDNVICTNETVRASLYLYNTKQDVDRLVNALKDITLEKCIEAAFLR